MSTIIKLKHNSGTGNAPLTSDLVLGELAVNSFDGHVFLKKNNGSEHIVNLSTDYVTYATLSDNSQIGTGATQVAQGDHNHDAAYEPKNANLLETTDVINDLTTGGTSVPLSAEMGKTLEIDKLETSTAPVFGTDTVTARTLNSDLTLDGNGTGGVVVAGDLTVQGDFTTTTSNEVEIGDSVIKLNALLDSGTAPTTDAGFEVERGSSSDVSILWDETADVWKLTDETSQRRILDENDIYTHPNHSGDVTSTGDGATVITDGAVTLTKMADLATDTFIGRTTAGSGVPEALSVTAARAILNVEDGADVTDATNVASAGAVMTTDSSTSGWSFMVDEDNMVSNSATKIPTQQSVKAYVDTEVATVVADGMVYKGDYNAATNSPDLDSTPVVIGKGDTYTVTVAGSFYSVDVSIGDVLIAQVASASSEADWTVVSKQQDTATTTSQGIVELATSAEVDTGTDTSRAITSDALANSQLATDVSTNNAKVSNIAGDLGYSTAASDGQVTTTNGNNVTLPAATTSLAGLLTGADKTKLNGIATNADNFGSWTIASDSGSEAIASNDTLTIAGGGDTTTSYDAPSNTLTVTTNAETTLAGLTDTTVTLAGDATDDGLILAYNEATDKWESTDTLDGGTF